MVRNTFFKDEKVFTKVAMAVEEAAQALQTSLPPGLAKSCPWAFKK